jgi:hypothetical protein
MTTTSSPVGSNLCSGTETGTGIVTSSRARKKKNSLALSLHLDKPTLYVAHVNAFDVANLDYWKVEIVNPLIERWSADSKQASSFRLSYQSGFADEVCLKRFIVYVVLCYHADSFTTSDLF